MVEMRILGSLTIKQFSKINCASIPKTHFLAFQSYFLESGHGFYFRKAKLKGPKTAIMRSDWLEDHSFNSKVYTYRYSILGCRSWKGVVKGTFLWSDSNFLEKKWSGKNSFSVVSFRVEVEIDSSENEQIYKPFFPILCVYFVIHGLSWKNRTFLIFFIEVICENCMLFENFMVTITKVIQKLKYEYFKVKSSTAYRLRLLIEE